MIVIYPGRPFPVWPEDRSILFNKVRDAAAGMKVVSPDTEADALKIAPEAEGWIGYMNPTLLAAAKKLRWLQSPSIGLETVMFPELIASDVIVTNMHHIADTAVSNHALALFLALCRDFPELFRRIHAREWRREANMRNVAEMTVLVLALGAIGSTLVRSLAVLGCKIVGVDPKVEVPPPGVSELARPDRLAELLPDVDATIVCAPLTPHTMGLFDEAMFKRMRRDAYFINVGRGKIVRTDALERALREGWIGAAAIDVADPEPIPPESKLWDCKNLIITPHVGGLGDPMVPRLLENVVENVRCFVGGRPFPVVADKVNWY